METHEESDEPVYVISVAARLAGMKTWYLRVLNDAGIVVPTRTDTNRRLYSANDVARLARVRYLTEERGVNMDGVKVIFEMEAAWQAERGESFAPKPATDTAPPADVQAILALLPAYVPKSSD
ncbi:MAG: MerR family transcriptional regulator [Armatimonadetes bacterium]|nr:MerR family transcriptional regulator [Armatimonadota bacterium]